MVAERWAPGRDWEGATVVCVGSGPSLTEAQAARVAAAHATGQVRVIAINRAWERTPFADLLWGCDARWWHWDSGQRALSQFVGVVATQDGRAVAEFPRLKWLEASEDTTQPVDSAARHGGFDARPGYVRTGRNGGYQALHLAVQRGARRVLLLGYDQRPAPDGRTHWHEPHPKATPPETYARLTLPCWPTILSPALDHGCSIVNVTPGSAIGCFRRSCLELEL